MRLSNSALRRLGVPVTAMGTLAVVLVFVGIGTPRDALRGYLEAAEHELSTWLAVGAVNARPLVRYELEIDPELRRATGLLPARAPGARETTFRDGGHAYQRWVPARFRAEGQSYGVEVRFDREPGAGGGADEGTWRVHFHGTRQYRGMRDIALTPASGEADAREVTARESARGLGLLAPLSGFAALRINGVEAGVVLWVEGRSQMMFERLGYDEGEVFALALDAFASERAGGATVTPVGLARSAFADDERARRGAPAQELRRLLDLAREATDAQFEREIPQFLNIEKYVAWNALAWLFGGPSPDVGPEVSWYYDPVTGLFEPTLAKLGRHPRAISYQTSVAEDLSPLGRRLFRVQRHRERRNRLLWELLSNPDLDVVAASGRRFRSLLPHLARDPESRGPGSLLRVARLRELIEAHLDARALLEGNAKRLRQILASSPIESEPRLALAGGFPGLALDRASHRAWGVALEERRVAMHAEPATHARIVPPREPQLRERPGRFSRRIEDVVEESGLPFRRRGDELVLPSGDYALSRTLVVPAGYRLTLEPGVSLELGPGVSILTFRGLIARGTKEQPIRIGAADSDRAWGSIGVVRAPEPSRLEHVVVRGGSRSVVDGIELSGQLAFNASALELSDSEIGGARRGKGLSLKRASFDIVRTHFVGNASDAVDAGWAQGSVRNCSFVDNGDDGLDLAGATVRIWDSSFRGMGDKAISAGEKSWVSVADSQIAESKIGIASKEDSRVDVARTDILRNEIGFALYRDKPIFGPGFGRVAGGHFSDNLHDLKIEQDSRLELKGVNQNYASVLEAVTGLVAPRKAFASGDSP